MDPGTSCRRGGWQPPRTTRPPGRGVWGGTRKPVPKGVRGPPGNEGGKGGEGLAGSRVEREKRLCDLTGSGETGHHDVDRTASSIHLNIPDERSGPRHLGRNRGRRDGVG